METAGAASQVGHVRSVTEVLRRGAPRGGRIHSESVVDFVGIRRAHLGPLDRMALLPSLQYSRWPAPPRTMVFQLRNRRSFFKSVARVRPLRIRAGDAPCSLSVPWTPVNGSLRAPVMVAGHTSVTIRLQSPGKRSPLVSRILHGAWPLPIVLSRCYENLATDHRGRTPIALLSAGSGALGTRTSRSTCRRRRHGAGRVPSQVYDRADNPSCSFSRRCVWNPRR